MPINDKAGERNKPSTGNIQAIPRLARDRQPRTFARAGLGEDTAKLVRPDVIPEPSVTEGLRVAQHRDYSDQAFELSRSDVARFAQRDGRVELDSRRPAGPLYLRVPARGTLEQFEWRHNAEALQTHASLVLNAENCGNENE